MVYGSTDLVNIVALALQQISIGSVNLKKCLLCNYTVHYTVHCTLFYLLKLSKLSNIFLINYYYYYCTVIIFIKKYFIQFIKIKQKDMMYLINDG